MSQRKSLKLENENRGERREERRERDRGVGLCCWGRKRDENRKFNSNVFVYFFS